MKKFLNSRTDPFRTPFGLKDLATEYRVSLIPTLIFFDKAGKEVFRHVGAWDKASIEGKLKEAGAA